MESLLSKLVVAVAQRLEAKYDLEATRLEAAGGDWQPRWKAEQKALAARKIMEALLDDEVTSEGK